MPGLALFSNESMKQLPGLSGGDSPRSPSKHPDPANDPNHNHNYTKRTANESLAGAYQSFGFNQQISTHGSLRNVPAASLVIHPWIRPR